jgi:two-component system, NtrC family, nitrogen regulation sensor histidine kinase NtrY
MPAPERRPLDLGKLIAETVLLQESARPGIRYASTCPSPPCSPNLDGTMIGQALTNLLKNAAEAIEERLADPGRPQDPGEIRVASPRPGEVVIDIVDNGRGLPDEAVRLYEPYVTHRAGRHRPRPLDRQEDRRGARRHARPAARAGPRSPGAWARITCPMSRPAATRRGGPGARRRPAGREAGPAAEAENTGQKHQELRESI